MRVFKFLFKSKYPNEIFDDDDFADIITSIIICTIFILILLGYIIKWCNK